MIDLANIKYFRWDSLDNPFKRIKLKSNPIIKESYDLAEHSFLIPVVGSNFVKTGDLAWYDSNHYYKIEINTNGDVAVGGFLGHVEAEQKWVIFMFHVRKEGTVFFDGKNYCIR